MIHNSDFEKILREEKIECRYGIGGKVVVVNQSNRKGDTKSINLTTNHTTYDTLGNNPTLMPGNQFSFFYHHALVYNMHIEQQQ